MLLLGRRKAPKEGILADCCASSQRQNCDGYGDCDESAVPTLSVIRDNHGRTMLIERHRRNSSQ